MTNSTFMEILSLGYSSNLFDEEGENITLNGKIWSISYADEFEYKQEIQLNINNNQNENSNKVYYLNTDELKILLFYLTVSDKTFRYLCELVIGFDSQKHRLNFEIKTEEEIDIKKFGKDDHMEILEADFTLKNKK